MTVAVLNAVYVRRHAVIQGRERQAVDKRNRISIHRDISKRGVGFIYVEVEGEIHELLASKRSHITQRYRLG